MLFEKRLFIGRFESLSEAMDFEARALSVGVEFLPAASVAVAFEGSTSDDDFVAHYKWLNEQLDAMEAQ